jgi:hypothetical protein
MRYYKVTYNSCNSPVGIQDFLESYYQKGWELVSVSEGVYIFKPINPLP